MTLTKVSISQAAKMVGVQRSTFYRHIDEKKITLEDADTNRPKVDVSELIRAYGPKLKTLEQIEQEEQDDGTNDATPSNISSKDYLELIQLREQVKSWETLHTTEKRRLEEQVEMLKESLDSEKEERKKATALLTDNRLVREKAEEFERKQSTEVEALQKKLAELQEKQDVLIANANSKKGFWQRLFGTGS